MHSGKTGSNDFFGGNDDVIGHKPGFQGLDGIVIYYVFGPIISVPGLTDTAHGKNIFVGWIDLKNSAVKAMAANLLTVTAGSFQAMSMAGKA
jgi:hypothetical protein